MELLENENENAQQGYHIKLEAFEGPLDLLLHLVKSAKISIEDIFISNITKQYIDFIAAQSYIDIEKAAEFIEMAAYLLELKSKALLPRSLDDSDNPVEDEQKEFIRKLEEYKLLKEASEKLKKQEITGAFFRRPDETVGDTRTVLGDLTMSGMLKALESMFLKLEKRALVPSERKIVLDRFTVDDKIVNIREYLLVKKQCVFTDLFLSDYSKGEMITTFQALLELLKLQELRVEQAENFGVINVRMYNDMM